MLRRGFQGVNTGTGKNHSPAAAYANITASSYESGLDPYLGVESRGNA